MGGGTRIINRMGGQDKGQKKEIRLLMGRDGTPDKTNRETDLKPFQAVSSKYGKGKPTVAETQGGSAGTLR